MTEKQWAANHHDAICEVFHYYANLTRIRMACTDQREAAAAMLTQSLLYSAQYISVVACCLLTTRNVAGGSVAGC